MSAPAYGDVRGRLALDLVAITLLTLADLDMRYRRITLGAPGERPASPTPA